MQQAIDFLEESETIYALIESLDEKQLDQKTAFKDWTINNVIGHLHTWNWAADLALQDGDAFKRFFAEVGKSDDGLTAFETEWLDGLSGQALAAEQDAAVPECPGRPVRVLDALIYRSVTFQSPELSRDEIDFDAYLEKYFASD